MHTAASTISTSTPSTLLSAIKSLFYISWLLRERDCHSMDCRAPGYQVSVESLSCSFKFAFHSTCIAHNIYYAVENITIRREPSGDLTKD